MTIGAGKARCDESAEDKSVVNFPATNGSRLTIVV